MSRNTSCYKAGVFLTAILVFISAGCSETYLDTEDNVKVESAHNTAAPEETVPDSDNAKVDASEKSDSKPSVPEIIFQRRKVSFPEEHIYGQLKISQWDPNYLWPIRPFDKPQGDVNVPEGYILGLTYSKGLDVDMRMLATLEPNDLQSLVIPGADINDANFANVMYRILRVLCR
ncbi:MAG: hypothetical protein ACYTBV_04365 [Planctomycetota bacterium]|jgi:hypothetical protein